jgi:hypothetical protein
MQAGRTKKHRTFRDIFTIIPALLRWIRTILIFEWKKISAGSSHSVRSRAT